MSSPPPSSSGSPSATGAALLPQWNSRQIEAWRGPKRQVDPWRPAGAFVEAEFSWQSPSPLTGASNHRLELASRGSMQPVFTLLLTNRECPFRCLMCDLWQHTTDVRVPVGAIPAQIAWGLAQLQTNFPGVTPAAVRQIKLYNAGNFFDPQAIPPEDWPAIAHLLEPFETILVECHPRLIGPPVVEFQKLLRGRLQVAMGLETIHPEILPKLNKQMTLADFERAAIFMRYQQIDIRAFVLLRPPGLSESEGIDWALQSVRYAQELGVECCSVIPTRAGNGALEQLEKDGHFQPPRIESLETVLQTLLAEQAENLSGNFRTFVDLWDIAKFYSCPICGPARAERLRQMNLTQQTLPPVSCAAGCRP